MVPGDAGPAWQGRLPAEAALAVRAPTLPTAAALTAALRLDS